MPAIQTSYSENIRASVPGHIPDMTHADLVSRTVQDAAGLAFGVPVFQGTADKAVRAFASGDTAAKFVGVTVLDRSASGPNGYVQYESARILLTGPISVTAAVAVAAGDPVTVTTTGTFSNTGGITVPNARWDTSGAAGAVANIFIK
ncbi:structural cement protein Gp24 [Pseudomonas rhizoryzae]|uniref:structural cement protein Gp24 n=1 Tax=Pseudomonas rhizoryzae TaxID=2571129 RepID=UPI0010C210D7|nr:DUF2190 family protein [Pseudomonas rhizoryzae]